MSAGLQAILDGSPNAPSPEELRAFAALRPGDPTRYRYHWRCVVTLRGHLTYHDGMSALDVEALRIPAGATARWWALGPDGAPVARPALPGAPPRCPACGYGDDHCDTAGGGLACGRCLATIRVGPA